MSADLKDWASIDLEPFWDGHYEDDVPTLLPLWDDFGAAYVGKVNTFMGEPASCKTWAALIACVYEIRKGNGALWIDLEDAPQTVVGRLKNLGVTRAELPLFQYKRPTSKPPQKVTEQAVAEAVGQRITPGSADQVARLVAQAEPFEALVQEITGCTIVVVDSVTELMSLYGLNGDVREEVSTFHKRLRELFTDNSAGIILLDHVTKSTAGRGRWASGSERKISGLDGSGIAFDVEEKFGRGKIGKIKLTISKDRPGYLDGKIEDGKTIGYMILTSDINTGAVTYEVEPHNWVNDKDRSKNTHVQQIIELLHRKGGLGVNAIQKELKMSKHTLLKCLALLVLEKVVEVTDGPNGTKIHTLIDHTSRWCSGAEPLETTAPPVNSGGAVVPVSINGTTAPLETHPKTTYTVYNEPTAEEIDQYLRMQDEEALYEWNRRQGLEQFYASQVPE